MSNTTLLPKNAITCRNLNDGWRLNYLYPNLATLTCPDGSRHCTYIGFDDRIVAQNSLEFLNPNYRAILRRGKRVGNPWEIKVWDLTTEAIFDLLKYIYREQ